jgi:hypothetical protein
MLTAKEIIEALKYDKAFVNKSIQNFNSGIFPYNGTEKSNLENLTDSILKDFMWKKKTTRPALLDHLHLSMKGGRVRTDANDILNAIGAG